MNTFITSAIIATVTFFFVRSCYREEERKRDSYALGWAVFMFLLSAAAVGLGLTGGGG